MRRYQLRDRAAQSVWPHGFILRLPNGEGLSNRRFAANGRVEPNVGMPRVVRGIERIEGVVPRSPPFVVYDTTRNVDALRCCVRSCLEVCRTVLSGDCLELGS